MAALTHQKTGLYPFDRQLIGCSQKRCLRAVNYYPQPKFRYSNICPMKNRCHFLGLVLAVFCLVFRANAEVVSNSTGVVELSLKGYIDQVFQHNESVQAQMLEAEVSHHKERGALGAFEPQFEASVDRE